MTAAHAATADTFGPTDGRDPQRRPRLRGASRRTAVLGFGVGAVVTCVVFWSALPFALGVAAIAAAAPGDDSPEGDAPAPSTAGVLLAALAIVGAFILCLVG